MIFNLNRNLGVYSNLVLFAAVLDWHTHEV
jgi:hypothetical protein